MVRRGLLVGSDTENVTESALTPLAIGGGIGTSFRKYGQMWTNMDFYSVYLASPSLLFGVI